MRSQTHIAFALASHTVLSMAAGWPLDATATGPYVLAAVCSQLPDVDSRVATIGRVFHPLARRIERRWGHRTATHSYVGQLAVALLAAPLLLICRRADFWTAIVAAYAGHCFLDTMTVQGCKMFWPWSSKQCVFPFDATQPHRFRTTTGGTGDNLLGIIFAGLTVPLLLVHSHGYARVVRLVQGDVAAAVRDFHELSATHAVTVDLLATHAVTGDTLRGRFPVVGTTSPSVLLIRGTDGNLYTVGEHFATHYTASHAVCDPAGAVRIETRQLDLTDRLLGEIDGLIQPPPGASVELFGELLTAEPVTAPEDSWRFNPISTSGGSLGATHRLRLEYATPADLSAAALDGVVIKSGKLTVKLIVPVGPSAMAATTAATSGTGDRFSLRPAGLTVDRELVTVIRVRAGDRVRTGDTLAVVDDPERRTAEDAAQVAALALSTAEGETVRSATQHDERIRQAATDRTAALARLDHARTQLTAGFVTAATVERVEAELARATDELNRRQSERDRDAQADRLTSARLRADLSRATARAAAVVARSVLRSPSMGTVRSADITEAGSTHQTIRVLLLVPKATPTTGAPTPAAGTP